MRAAFLLLAAVLLSGPAGAKLVSAGAGRSWGKAGVSFAAYREDSLACAREAAALDLAGSDPARALVVASRMIENDPTAGPGATFDPNAGGGVAVDAVAGAGSTAGAVRMIGPDRQIAKAGDLMKASLDRCLAGRGYREFRLTGAQRRHLARLAPGSDERRAYLHGLASDAEVLARQHAD
ncbi:MAG: hypothetical protein JOZ90_13870 [Alphaproteobacteria bacterium]|nr:hypothetical protein [Alphaproteobacteria bacterium]MBV9372486.1 hypothetical protein [Alphaproteobacteria bacterium]MBV9902161.1 hypothetical protein [Alphaproteobacteria bacterium]